MALTDLDQERREIAISPSTTVSLAPGDRVFAVHSGADCLVFCAKGPEQFGMWSTAFAKVEVPEFRDPDLWVDSARSDAVAVTICRELSARRANLSTFRSVEGACEGYLCKTAQTLGKTLTRGKIFYKRHYAIDDANRELLVRGAAGSAVKERFPLDKLLKVDDSLRPSLRPG